MPLHAIVPDVFKHWAAPLRAGNGAISVRRPCIPYERCGAMPSCRMCSSTVQPSVRAERPAAAAMQRHAVAPAVLAPASWPGNGRVRQRSALVQDAVANGAAPQVEAGAER